MRDSKQSTAVQNRDKKVVCGDICCVCHALCFLVFDGRIKKKSIILQVLVLLHELVQLWHCSVSTEEDFGWVNE